MTILLYSLGLLCSFILNYLVDSYCTWYVSLVLSEANAVAK